MYLTLMITHTVKNVACSNFKFQIQNHRRHDQREEVSFRIFFYLCVNGETNPEQFRLIAQHKLLVIKFVSYEQHKNSSLEFVNIQTFRIQKLSDSTFQL